jgi:hypothetical protein
MIRQFKLRGVTVELRQQTPQHPFEAWVKKVSDLFPNHDRLVKPAFLFHIKS